MPSEFPREGFATDSENNFKNQAFTHPPTQFPRCRNSPQSNKYLINQSRIFSLFRYPFFKYSSDLYRLEGTSKHKSFSNYIILAYFRARKLPMFYDILFPDLSRPRSLSLEFLALRHFVRLGKNSSRRAERCGWNIIFHSENENSLNFSRDVPIVRLLVVFSIVFILLPRP